jgi:hypothetical protein
MVPRPAYNRNGQRAYGGSTDQQHDGQISNQIDGVEAKEHL